MPIEFGFVRDGEDEEIGSCLVEPGEGAIFSDFSEGDERLLAISCDIDDCTGEVMILPAEGPLAEKIGDEIPKDEMPEPIGIIKVYEDKPYEQDLIDGDGNVGTLRVRYVAGGIITQSGIISRSLRHPN